MENEKNPLAMSAEARHRETLGMLAEAMDYLSRMPRVPVTTAMVKRIQEHLDLPENLLAARMVDEFAGMKITPAGQILAEARLRGGKLVVSIPKTDGTARGNLDRAHLDSLALAQMREGMTIALRNTGAKIDSDEQG